MRYFIKFQDFNNNKCKQHTQAWEYTQVTPRKQTIQLIGGNTQAYQGVSFQLQVPRASTYFIAKMESIGLLSRVSGSRLSKHLLPSKCICGARLCDRMETPWKLQGSNAQTDPAHRLILFLSGRPGVQVHLRLLYETICGSSLIHKRVLVMSVPGNGVRKAKNRRKRQENEDLKWRGFHRMQICLGKRGYASLADRTVRR